MEEYLSIAKVPGSATRAESSSSASKTPVQRGAVLIWNENPPESRQRSLNAEVILDRLRAAVADIFAAVSNGLRGERESAKRCMQRAAVILQVDPWFANAIEGADLPSEERSKPVRGGLAPWQVRRVRTHIEANLDGTIRVKDLAALIKLSPSYFSRAFKNSVADTPHNYVMHRRLERAQELMLTTDASLGQIAADCGFADQAHFNKLFRRLVGERPGAWRRARGCGRILGDRSTLDPSGLEPLEDAQADGPRPRGGHGLDQIGILRLNG